jgi:hypothetical protein
MHSTKVSTNLIFNCQRIMSRDSAVGTATPYGLGRGVGFRFRIGAGFVLYPRCLYRLWSPPRLLSNGYWGHFPPGKEPGGDATHSPPTSSEVKNTWNAMLLRGVVLNCLSTGTTLPLPNQSELTYSGHRNPSCFLYCNISVSSLLNLKTTSEL